MIYSLVLVIVLLTGVIVAQQYTMLTMRKPQAEADKPTPKPGQVQTAEPTPEEQRLKAIMENIDNYYTTKNPQKDVDSL